MPTRLSRAAVEVIGGSVSIDAGDARAVLRRDARGTPLIVQQPPNDGVRGGATSAPIA